ncbi:MAG: trypsin-like peptidase domain-containing protein [Parcubacteria group bacterium]|nr:trypsin-like peptidase domain-containing protein [Parcubacteria group bacterium]
MAKNWHTALNELNPFIFRVLTPGGWGTGFQVLYPNDRDLCGIATAYHVIDHAEEWEEPIKIVHHTSGKSALLKEKDRVIFTYPLNDLAFILFSKKLLPLEEGEPRLIDPQKVLKQGVETGWCGFPHIAPQGELCFFSGHISACLSSEDYYLVDGVAINGVSGGPAFYIDAQTAEVKICGVISAYKPNRIYGEAHPGLSKVCSVEPYQEMLKRLRSREDAKEKAKEEKEKQENVEVPPESPPSEKPESNPSLTTRQSRLKKSGKHKKVTQRSVKMKKRK